jgi:CRP-like cAMP-binding protein
MEPGTSEWLKASVREIRLQLQTVPFFSDVLPADQMEELASLCEPRAFAPGSVLMKQGDPADSMLCLIEGAVRVTHETKKSKSTEIIRLRAGSVVGEMEVLAGQLRLATVTAIDNVRALEIPKSALERILRQSPELAESLRATLGRRNAIYSQITASGMSLFQKIFRAIWRRS